MTSASDGGSPLPSDWEMSFDEANQRWYFINHVDKRTTWDDPRMHLKFELPDTLPEQKLFKEFTANDNSTSSSSKASCSGAPASKPAPKKYDTLISYPGSMDFNSFLQTTVRMNKLKGKFPRVDQARIESLLKSNNYDFIAVEKILEDELNSKTSLKSKKLVLLNDPKRSDKRNSIETHHLPGRESTTPSTDRRAEARDTLANRSSSNASKPRHTTNTAAHPLMAVKTIREGNKKSISAERSAFATATRKEPQARLTGSKRIAQGSNKSILLPNVGCRRSNIAPHICLAKGPNRNLASGPMIRIS